MAMKKYNLVHITTGGEYKTPLVQSQLFDQAEAQAIVKEGFYPQKVHAWILGSFREYFDRAGKKKGRAIRRFCPHVKVGKFNGIDRLNRFPIYLLLTFRRLLMGSTPVVYHCRGEAATKWGLKQKKLFKKDRVVIDVRGYWPAELLYKHGIEYVELANGALKSEHDRAKQELKDLISEVDGITTVSEALRELLMSDLGAPDTTIVVPCCINKITEDNRRNEIRKKWGICDGEIAVVYSGTTAAYQHLEDLTIPFLHKLVNADNAIRIVMLSPESDKVTAMIAAAGIDKAKVVIANIPHKEVAEALTACDAGVLIRKPTLVNRVANPVKIAEYFAAGLPIIIEEGVGGLPDRLYQRSLIKGIKISSPKANMDHYVSEVMAWLNDDLDKKRSLIREEARTHLLWSSAIQTSRSLYQQIL